MNKVFIANDPVEAHFVRSLLEQEGIAAQVRGEALFGLRPRIGIASDTLPAVWVTDEDQLQPALNFIAEYERRKRTRSRKVARF